MAQQFDQVISAINNRVNEHREQSADINEANIAPEPPVDFNTGCQEEESNDYVVIKQEVSESPRAENLTGTVIMPMDLEDDSLKDYEQDLTVALKDEDAVLSTPIGELAMNMKPITTFNIKDNSGMFSQILTDWVRKTQCNIIPGEVAGIPKELTEVKGFAIIQFGGKRYFSSKAEVASEGELQQYCSMIVQGLQSEGYFQGTLLIHKEGTDYAFNTIRFNHNDLSRIVSTFKDWNPRIYTKFDDLVLHIGALA